MNRTLWAASFSGDTFEISTFETSGNAVIHLGGNDWSDFFDTDQSSGSWGSYRYFTVNDGTSMATIELERNYTNIEGLVDGINDCLAIANVNAIAEKVSNNQFKIRATAGINTLIIDGLHSSEFF